MNKESRLNIIFLIVLLAVMVPGAVMLFRKKLEPTARPMYLPDPVRQTLVYISPYETPPGMTRSSPPHIREWVNAQSIELTGPGLVQPRDEMALPVMSARKQFEVVGYRRGEDGLTVLVLFWTPPPRQARWSINGQPGAVAQSQEVVLPALVRDELGAHGLLVPPKQVVFQRLRFGDLPDGDWALTLTAPGEEEEGAKIVTTFTSQAATSH